MKKLFILFTVLMFSFSSAYAIEENIVTYKDTNIIGAQKSEEAKIKSLLVNLNKYSNEHNIKALKAFYSKDYTSFDGFNYDAFFASIKETFETYPDISYKSKTKSVNVYDNWATAEIYDVTVSNKQALTHAIINNQPVSNKSIEGTMESKCHYIVYFKKVGGKWLIYSDSVISEETSIKYGIANNMKMALESPLVANGGEQYCVSLNIENKPKDSIMLASLAREEIKFPPVMPNEKFRKIPATGILERMVTANKTGANEYSLASIGIAEISLNDQKTAINFQMSGIAFLMKRVNVYHNQNVVDREYLKQVKEKETL